MWIYVYIQLTHFVTQQKLTHHVKQLYSNKDVKKTKNLIQEGALHPLMQWFPKSKLHISAKLAAAQVPVFK